MEIIACSSGDLLKINDDISIAVLAVDNDAVNLQVNAPSTIEVFVPAYEVV